MHPRIKVFVFEKGMVIHMKQVRIVELMPGMVSGEDVYSLSGQLLIPRGVQITPAIISLLHSHALHSIKISTASNASITSPDATLSPSYNEKVRSSEEFKQFYQDYQDHIQNFQTNINDVVTKNAPLDVEYLLEETLSLLYQDGKSVHALDMLMNVRDHDDCTYTHCVNVALICNVFARWLHLSEEEQRLAMACGLFHDIGKMNIPIDLLEKQGMLTTSEFEQVKAHSLEGYMLLNRYDVNQQIKNAALMHHEKCDGTGYPYGLKGSQIDSYAKLVCIADIYDAMTSRRPHRSAFCPFMVIEEFEREGFQKYDTRFILTFLENIANTYINQRVRLNDDREGEIIFINRISLSRPTIKCSDGSFLDLSEVKDLYIEEIL